MDYSCFVNLEMNWEKSLVWCERSEERNLLSTFQQGSLQKLLKTFCVVQVCSFLVNVYVEWIVFTSHVLSEPAVMKTEMGQGDGAARGRWLLNIYVCKRKTLKVKVKKIIRPLCDWGVSEWVIVHCTSSHPVQAIPCPVPWVPWNNLQACDPV